MRPKIAELSDKISVRYFETTRNNRGDILNREEKERCRVWAKVYPLTARNIESTPERANKITYRVTIRYRTDILPDDEVIWRGRRLKLLSPPYLLDGEKVYIAFECEEVVANGRT